LSVYKHVPSGQTESTMPEAYERYLCEFDRFMRSQETAYSSETMDVPSGDCQEFEESATTRVSQKRRHILADDIIDTETNALQGLLGYSDSSGAEKEQCDGLNARQRRRMKRAHRRNMTTSRLSNATELVEVSQPAEFIGPLLPVSACDPSQDPQGSPTLSNSDTSDSKVSVVLKRLPEHDSKVSVNYLFVIIITNW
uniref:PHM7_ext domain-containing protein n=1 Tax=Echinostoma caproni TaxID=27848 RepID=A0A183BAV3_9TREM